jgi:hypothetical protein
MALPEWSDIIAEKDALIRRMSMDYREEMGQLWDILALRDEEIKRLKAGGCARDQSTTQYCAEAARLVEENERLRAEVSGLRILLNSIPPMVEKYGTFYIDPDGKIHDSGIGKMIAHDIRSMLNTNEKLIIGVRASQNGGGNDH